MEVSALLPKMLIFVVLMVVGYLCAKTNFAGKEFTRDASKMVINVFMAATIINSVLVSDARLSGKELAVVMLALSIAILVGWVLPLLPFLLIGWSSVRPCSSCSSPW